MKVQLLIDDVELQVGYELLETIADRIGDHSEFSAVYHKLAQNKNPEVRYAIAYYDNILPETAELLANDIEPKIVERVCDGSERIAKISEETIIEIIDQRATTDILKAIVNNFTSVDSEEPNSILDLIIQRSDDNFDVLGAIADSWDTPKYILKKLAKHRDPDIVRKAKESLNR